MLKKHLKIPTKSKTIQVLELCILAYKPLPHNCFEMIFFQNVIFLCSAISKQLKTAQFSLYMEMLHFIILNHFQPIKYLIMLK